MKRCWNCDLWKTDKYQSKGKCLFYQFTSEYDNECEMIHKHPILMKNVETIPDPQ